MYISPIRPVTLTTGWFLFIASVILPFTSYSNKPPALMKYVSFLTPSSSSTQKQLAICSARSPQFSANKSHSSLETVSLADNMSTVYPPAAVISWAFGAKADSVELIQDPPWQERHTSSYTGWRENTHSSNSKCWRGHALTNILIGWGGKGRCLVDKARGSLDWLV